MHLLRALAVLSALPLCALGHVRMITPFPIRSPDDQAETNKDYDYNKPLSASGSDFPCKGYHKLEPQVSKATYKAGGQGSLKFAPGGALHGGGSCQISLSIDNGATFKVIKSMIGGCPITPEYQFTIPADTPSSNNALLSWSWFNKIGNREMYQNCGRVTIEGSAPGRHRRAEISKRAFSDLPDMFTCNIGNGCTTKEGTNVEFPNPGTDVVRGEGSSQQGDAGFNGGAGGGSASTGAATAPSPTSDPSANTGKEGGVEVIPISSPAPAPSASASPVAPPPAPAPPAAGSGGSCPTVGAIICDSEQTWSMCSSSNTPISMGQVAAGTRCVGGAIV